MKAQGYDLRMLIIKSDLEVALLETYQRECKVLNNEEKLAFIRYQEDSSDIFDYVRQLLLQVDNKDESVLLFEKAQNDIRVLYPDDKVLNDNISELGNIFISSIEQGNGDSKNLFFQKARILK